MATLEQMGTLAPRASEVLTAKNMRIIYSYGMKVGETLWKVFGDRRHRVNFGPPTETAEWRNEPLVAMVRLGMPVLPAKRPDGHEYLPLIDRARRLDVATVNELAEAGVDFSHHSHLGLCERPRD